MVNSINSTIIRDQTIYISQDLFKDPQSFIIFLIAIIIGGIFYLKWKKML